MNSMTRIKSSKGIFKSITLLQVLAISIFFLGVVNSFPNNPKLDAATKKILARARHIKKPKGYAAILKKAKKYDKTNETAYEVNELGEPKKVAQNGRGFISDKKKLWKYEMFVVIDKAFRRKQKKDVESAIYTLKKAMKCFDFKIVNQDLPNHVDHVHIKPEDKSMGGASCASYLGKQGGKQVVVVGDKCTNIFGVAMHEVMHALGFFHEHVRKDRDKYVKIDWNQLQDPGWAAQYKIREDQYMVNNYDFDSIMQYPFNAAMQPKVNPPKGAQPGQRSHLSETDLKRLLMAYPCK